MAFTLTSLISSVENIIIKNNTTTSSYDVSASLKKRLQRTYKGVDGLNETIPIPNTVYPVCFVELVNKSEDFAELGKQSRRSAIINFNIIPVTSYGLGSTVEADARENAALECVTLSQNIEYMLRNFINISQTVDWAKITNVSYNYTARQEQYCYMSKIELQCSKLIT